MQEKIVKILEVSEQTVLFECSMDDISSAYEYAKELEEMGIDIEIIAPSAPETLVISLGGEKEDLLELKENIEKEVSEHN